MRQKQYNMLSFLKQRQENPVCVYKCILIWIILVVKSPEEYTVGFNQVWHDSMFEEGKAAESKAEKGRKEISNK